MSGKIIAAGFCEIWSDFYPINAITVYKNVVRSSILVFLPRMNEGNRRIRGYTRIEGCDPPGTVCPCKTPAGARGFLGHGGGSRICRISREISRRRLRQRRRIHILHGRPMPPSTSLHRICACAVTIRLNYTPNSRHMVKGVTSNSLWSKPSAFNVTLFHRCNLYFLIREIPLLYTNKE